MKKKMYFWMILLVLILGSMTGCKNQNTNKKTNTQGQVESDIKEEISVDVTSEPTPNDTSSATEDETKTVKEDSDKEVGGIEVPVFTVESKDIDMNESLEFVQDMQVGWNLGNTFDASNDRNPSADELSYESMWSGTKTTQEMITAIKAAGFQTIRIPVSWHNHVSGDNYTISDVWMNRVQEVIDYAVNEDMYIIINIHHDILEGYYYPTKEQFETSSKYITSIWKQIAERFIEYDDHLIFEAINEPRMRGTNYEWWLDMNVDECKEAVDCINRLNQQFVDTVRATGGINATRYLMVPGYCASPEFALIDQFVLPTDLETNINKIIVSVHAYTPYKFALQSQNESGSTDMFSIANKIGTGDIDYFMNRLYHKFISNGTPVVIGEFGARDKGGNVQDRTEYTAYYVASARANGITCIWWDNNAFAGTGENFGLFKRQRLTWLYEVIKDALIQYSK